MIVKVDASVVQRRNLLLEHGVREHCIQSSVDGIRKAGDVVGFDIIYAQGRQAQQVSIRCLALRKQSAGNMTADKAIAETFKNTVCVLSLGVLDGCKQLLGRLFAVHIDEFGLLFVEFIQVYGIGDKPTVDEVLNDLRTETLDIHASF